MNPSNMQELVDAAVQAERARREAERKRAAAEIADAQLKVVTATFDRAAAYTNLMMLGAYAGFFGLWQLTKEFLSRPQALWSALLMLASIATFVLFEVYKVTHISTDTFNRARALRLPENQSSPEVLLARLRELDAAHIRSEPTFMRVWQVVMVVTISAGLVAAGILAYAFVAGLLQTPSPVHV